MSDDLIIDSPSGVSKRPSFMLLPLRIAGSFALGLALLAVLMCVLAWGTFIESEYGSSAAQFVLYHTYWFAGLLAALGLNIVCAMILRFPWRFYYLPFLTVHIGILVLLYGCWQTWHNGEESQITLPEGTVGRQATQTAREQLQFNYIAHGFTKTPEMLKIGFAPGPFNWKDYDYDNWQRGNKKYKTTLWHALQLAHRDIGKLTVSDPHVKVEVLDYLADSALEPVLPLELDILWKQTVKTKNELGEESAAPRNWERVSLAMHNEFGAGLQSAGGASTSMSRGERVTYFTAVSQQELDAFLAEPPAAQGFWGTVSLYYNGKNHLVSVDELMKLTSGQWLKVENTELEVGEVRFREQGPIINFSILAESGIKETMTLFPDNPEMNVQARQLGVFGSYWVQPAAILANRDYVSHPAIQRLKEPRYDFVQGHDKKLYYRLWSGEKIVANGECGKELTVAAGTPLESTVSVARFMPQDVPGARIVASEKHLQHRAERRAQLKVTFDGKEDIFWLRAVVPTVVPLPPEADQVRYLYGKNRTLTVTWDFERIDLGFSILLKKFERRVEPGTKMSSWFSSQVDFCESAVPGGEDTPFSNRYQDYKPLPEGKDIVISMNRPAYFQGTGKGYRIYQSSYLGPYYPNQPQFFELYDGKIFSWENKPRESISMSTLSVSYDPGRGWKYFGCFLILAGTAWFVWRRKI